MSKFDKLLAEIRACTICAPHFEHQPRPIIKARPGARLMLIGQAPGTRVHESGIPWDDASGDRLRQWLHMDKQTFYDENRIAIVPMGFCFPGQDKNGSDKPPRPECAPTWHPPVLKALANIGLTLLIGGYAQKQYLGPSRNKTMTETVRAWRDYGPDVIALPHPSWRNTGWLKKNPWFETDLLPDLRQRAGAALA